MAVNEPIVAISQWPDDAPRGAVSTFCAEHGISRNSFYELRKRAKEDGPAAILEPRTRRPKSTPSTLSDEVKARAVAVRSALEPHQGLPGRITPLTAWEATPKADPPRPTINRPAYAQPVPKRYQFPRAQSPVDLPANTVIRTVGSIGNISLDSVTYRVDAQRAFQQVLVLSVDDKVIVADLDGEVLVEHTRPAPGVKYVGNGRPRGPHPKNDKPSPMS